MSTPSQATIAVLSPQLANQIAAGEVVERPASVVKELVENSLDAGATQIHVEIEQGGQKRILIRDNGSGIAKDQLVLALSRHATSKISDIDDLEHITSMGFRGEALASISSVSRLKLTSKPQAQSEAWQAQAEGRDMQVEVTPAAHPDGTSIEVLDLFFNTPARRKFLRTGKTEFQHIEQIIKRIALTRVDVQFVLVHNQKTIFKYPSGKALAQRIEQVCGKQMLLNSVPVDYYYEGLSLKGWCSQLGAGVPTRDLQYTFVNGRMMKDKLLGHALRQVFDETLPPQTFPCYALYLQVPPEQLDVNVHPAKHEVRFHQSRKVHDLVFKAVNDAISSDLLTGDEQSNVTNEPVNHGYIQPLKSTEEQTSYTQPSSLTGMRSTSRQPSSYFNADKPSRAQVNAAHKLYQGKQTDTHNAEQQNDARPSDTLVLNASSFVIAGQYIALSGNDESNPDAAVLNVLPIMGIVQALVSARIDKTTVSQALLMPVSVQIEQSLLVSADSKDKTLSNTDFNQQNEFLSQYHFDCTKMSNRLVLKKVPSELRQLPWAVMFAQISHDLMSCRAKAELEEILSVAWFNHCQIEANVVQAWLVELGSDKVSAIMKDKAKKINIEQWMQEA